MWFGAIICKADGIRTGVNPIKNLNGKSRSAITNALGAIGRSVAGKVMPRAAQAVRRRHASIFPCAIQRLESQPANSIPSGPAMSDEAPAICPALCTFQPQKRMKRVGYQESA